MKISKRQATKVQKIINHRRAGWRFRPGCIKKINIQNYTGPLAWIHKKAIQLIIEDVSRIHTHLIAVRGREFYEDKS
tara:strand:- start:289 stop:519 length:231 start_codon:yes stop_codon:yes gene_type:complete